MELLFDRLFPITRSISGNGLRESLRIIQEIVPIEILEYKSGTKCFDWTIPDEWNIREAFIKSLDGKTIVDFNDNNLHIMGYSEPFSGRITLQKLKEHLHSLPEKPGAIPFVTSYYKKNWGFCLSHNKLMSMTDSEYDVYIDSDLKPGSISLGELLMPRSWRKTLSQSLSP